MADDDITIRVRAIDLARFTRDMDKAADDVRKPGHAADDSAKDFDKLIGRLNVFGRIQKLVKPAALITGLGAAAGAAAALTAGAVALAGALAPAAGILAAYPGLGLAAAQGMGTFRLATLGLSKQLQGFTKAFDRPTLAGARFGRFLNQFVGPLRKVQAVTQRRFLAGVTDGIKSASRNLPILSKLVEQTSTVFARFARRAGAELGSKAFGSDLQIIGRRNLVVLNRMGAAALHVANALRHVVVAAGPLVGWLTKMVLRWARGAEEAAKQGRETGRLAAFFEKTRRVLSRLFSIAGSLARAFWNIGKAASPLGNDLLKIIDRNAAAFARWTGSVSGQNKIAKFFRDAKAPLLEAGRLIRDVVKAFFSLGSGSQGGLAPLLRIIRTQLLPVLVNVVNSTTKAFGPAFVQTLTDLAKAFAPMLGSSGPLVLFVKAMGLFARAALAIERAIPGASSALSIFAGSFAVVQALGIARFTSNLFGVRSGLNAVSGGFKAVGSAIDTAKLGMSAMRLAFVANGGAANASNLAVLRAAAAAKIQAVSSKIAAVATRVWAAAQWLLNAALTANPIALIIAAVVAFVAAFVVAYKKIGWFRAGVNAAFGAVKRIVVGAFNFIRSHWRLIAAVLFGPIGIAVGVVTRHFGTIKRVASSAVHWITGRFGDLVGFIRRLPGKIASVAKGMWKPISSFFKSAINAVIGIWNKLHFSIGGWKIHGPGPLPDIHIPHVTVGMPHIPTLARGGHAVAGGAAVVGDAGPELIDMPTGATVHPLSGAHGDELAEKIAAAMARLMPERPVDVHLFGDRVGRGMLRWLEDQGAALG